MFHNTDLRNVREGLGPYGDRRGGLFSGGNLGLLSLAASLMDSRDRRGKFRPLGEQMSRGMDAYLQGAYKDSQMNYYDERQDASRAASARAEKDQAMQERKFTAEVEAANKLEAGQRELAKLLSPPDKYDPNSVDPAFRGDVGRLNLAMEGDRERGILDWQIQNDPQKVLESMQLVPMVTGGMLINKNTGATISEIPRPSYQVKEDNLANVYKQTQIAEMRKKNAVPIKQGGAITQKDLLTQIGKYDKQIATLASSLSKNNALMTVEGMANYQNTVNRLRGARNGLQAQLDSMKKPAPRNRKDVERQSIENAREAIAKDPTIRQAVIDKLRDYGIQIPDDL